MYKEVYIAIFLVLQINIGVSANLLANFQDFFDFNAPVTTGNETGSQDTGFPPDPGFPPQDSGFPPQDSEFPPQDSGLPPQDSGFPPLDTGFPPEDTGFPPQDTGSQSESGVNADSIPAGAGTAPQGGSEQITPADSGLPPLASDSAITNDLPTVQDGFPPIEIGAPVDQFTSVDPLQPMPITNNQLGNNVEPFPVGLPAQPQPFNPAQPVEPAFPVPVGLGPLPVGPAVPDNTMGGGIPAVPTNVGGAVFPPFDVPSTDPQVIGDQIPANTPTSLDFHFLPSIPQGDNFVNLVTGDRNTFEPSLGWLGNPGQPVELDLTGPVAVGPAQPGNVPFEDHNAETIPVVNPIVPTNNQIVNPAPIVPTNSQVVNPAPIIPVVNPIVPTNNQVVEPIPTPTVPVVPVDPIKPIDTKPAVKFDQFIDPLAPALDQSQTGILDQSQAAGGMQGGGFNQVTGGISPGNKPRIISLFDPTEKSQTLGNGKPANLPFEVLGPASIPKPTQAPTSKVPNSWMQLYPSGRRPNRPVMATPVPTPVSDAVQESAAERILYGLSLGSFGRNRDLDKQLRRQRKQSRRQQRKQRNQRRQQRQQNQQMRWTVPKVNQRSNPQQPRGRLARINVPANNHYMPTRRFG